MLKEKPDDQELHIKLADIYYSTGKIEEAYGLLSNLEQNNRLNAEKYYLLCKCCYIWIKANWPTRLAARL
jgi:predicted Zn-dependent protease